MDNKTSTFAVSPEFEGTLDIVTMSLMYFGLWRVSNCHIYVLLSQPPFASGYIHAPPGTKSINSELQYRSRIDDQVI
jgi:hypothetical protein